MLSLCFCFGRITFACATPFEGTDRMAIPEFLTFLIAPVGVIIFAFIMLYVTRQDRIDAEKKRSSH
jgi:hypothetical protein